MKIRQYLLIYSFIVCCFVSVGLTSLGQFNRYGTIEMPSSAKKNADEIDESYFKNVVYFLVEKNKPFLNFQSELLTLSTIDSKILGVNPKGQVLRETNEAPIYFQSKNVRVNYDKKIINLENEVSVSVDNTDLNSDHMKILLNENLLEASGNVKSLSTNSDQSEQVMITGREVSYRPKLRFFEFRNQVKGDILRKKKYEESVHFSTDLLNFDGIKSLVELKGNVALVRNNYNILANNGSIFLENYNKKLKYYALSDDVRLEEKVESDGRKFSRKAFSEKLEGVMSEKKIILTGLPKVFQDKDVIKGNIIVIRENVETVEVDDANTNITLKGEEKRE